MNELAARRYFSRTGMIYVLEKIIVSYNTTVIIKQYESIDEAVKHVNRSKNAIYMGRTAAVKAGFEDG